MSYLGTFSGYFLGGTGRLPSTGCTFGVVECSCTALPSLACLQAIFYDYIVVQHPVRNCSSREHPTIIWQWRVEVIGQGL
jgi:hypothetical protein